VGRRSQAGEPEFSGGKGLAAAIPLRDGAMTI
jgi:hypothetical protein